MKIVKISPILLMLSSMHSSHAMQTPFKGVNLTKKDREISAGNKCYDNATAVAEADIPIKKQSTPRDNGNNNALEMPPSSIESLPYSQGEEWPERNKNPMLTEPKKVIEAENNAIDMSNTSSDDISEWSILHSNENFVAGEKSSPTKTLSIIDRIPDGKSFIVENNLPTEPMMDHADPMSENLLQDLMMTGQSLDVQDRGYPYFSEDLITSLEKNQPVLPNNPPSNASNPILESENSEISIPDSKLNHNTGWLSPEFSEISQEESTPDITTTMNIKKLYQMGVNKVLIRQSMLVKDGGLQDLDIAVGEKIKGYHPSSPKNQGGIISDSHFNQDILWRISQHYEKTRAQTSSKKSLLDMIAPQLVVPENTERSHNQKNPNYPSTHRLDPFSSHTEPTIESKEWDDSTQTQDDDVDENPSVTRNSIFNTDHLKTAGYFLWGSLKGIAHLTLSALTASINAATKLVMSKNRVLAEDNPIILDSRPQDKVATYTDDPTINTINSGTTQDNEINKSQEIESNAEDETVYKKSRIWNMLDFRSLGSHISGIVKKIPTIAFAIIKKPFDMAKKMNLLENLDFAQKKVVETVKSMTQKTWDYLADLGTRAMDTLKSGGNLIRKKTEIDSDGWLQFKSRNIHKMDDLVARLTPSTFFAKTKTSVSEDLNSLIFNFNSPTHKKVTLQPGMCISVKPIPVKSYRDEDDLWQLGKKFGKKNYFLYQDVESKISILSKRHLNTDTVLKVRLKKKLDDETL